MEIRCTNCGADLPLERDSDFISCSFCQTALFVDEDQTVTSYYMRPELARGDLSSALSQKLAAMDISPAHHIENATMVFHPFWRFDTGGDKVLLLTAADAPAFEMAERYAPGGRPVAFNPSVVGETRVMEPDTRYHEAKQSFESTWASGHPKDKVRELGVLAVSLVYFPLYHVTYESSGNPYRAWVDGASGKVFADDWPPNSEKKKNLVLGSVGLGVLAAFFAESLLIPFSLILIVLYGVTAIIIFYLSLFALEHLDAGGRE